MVMGDTDSERFFALITLAIRDAGRRRPRRDHRSREYLELHSNDAAVTPLVVIASERISDEPGWQEIHPGELVPVGPDLKVDRETIVSGPPGADPMVLTADERETQSYD